MTIRRPGPGEIRDAGAELGLTLSEADAESFLGLMQGLFDSYDIVDTMVEPLPETCYPRTPGRRPEPSENPYGAWAVLSTIRGAIGVLARLRPPARGARIAGFGQRFDHPIDDVVAVEETLHEAQEALGIGLGKGQAKLRT
ncbi:MAG: hypothetical protein AAGF76_04845, partial [Pseudomonadota bacterium]